MRIAIVLRKTYSHILYYDTILSRLEYVCWYHNQVHIIIYKFLDFFIFNHNQVHSLTSHTVRTRIHPNIEDKQGQMQLYQQLHRHGMQDCSRSRKENLKPESTDGSWHQTRSNSSTVLMNAEMEWG